MDDAQAREAVFRVEHLLEELESVSDPAAREKATAIVEALVALYGEGLGRVVAQLAERDDGRLAAALAEDELVAHLLLLHDLHPVPLEARVRGALDQVRPYLESHGGDVELLGVAEGVARLRLSGSCSGCPSSTMTLKLAIEDAIFKAAPDVVAVEAEGAAAEASPLIQLEPAGGPGAPASAPSAPIQLEVVAPRNGTPEREPEARASWAMAGAMPELAGRRRPLLKRVSGEQLLFLRLGDDVYAYRPGCPGCDDPLAEAALDGTALVCPGCGNRYDVLRAGRCLDVPELHLEPVPLLAGDDGLVRVALAAPA